LIVLSCILQQNRQLITKKAFFLYQVKENTEGSFFPKNGRLSILIFSPTALETNLTFSIITLKNSQKKDDNGSMKRLLELFLILNQEFTKYFFFNLLKSGRTK
jgi:hypothetical protein